MKFLKSIFFYVFVLCFFTISSFAHLAAQEEQDSENKNPETEEITEEDQEIIENLELLENWDWLMEIDLELLKNLEFFLINS